MKVFLLKDVKQVGLKGEMLQVSDGFAQNFLLPRKLAVQTDIYLRLNYQTHTQKKV